MTDTDPNKSAPAGRTSRLAERGRRLGRRVRDGILSLARKNKFVFMAVVVGVFTLAMVLWMKIAADGGAGPKGPLAQEGGGTVAVNVVELKPDRFQDIMQVIGSIFGGSEVEMRFETEGNITRFDFREGDKVRKGDVIAVLNQRDAALKLKRARLELEQMEKLYAIGGVSLLKLEEARVQADLAAVEYDKTILRASRDGILGEKNAEVGEFVTPVKRVVTLVNIDTVKVRIGIVERDIDRVFPGLKVFVTVDTYPNVEFTGRVENINPIIPGSRTMDVEARLDNEGGLLLPGMFARVRIMVHEQDNVLFVPNDAVEKTATGSQVFIVNKDNKAEIREVEVTYTSTQFSVIGGGLAAGDLVITQRPQELKADTPVKIIEKS